MGTYSKYAISHIILRIIQSNKNYYTLETFLYRIMLISLIVKILSEGTFSRVVAQMHLKHWYYKQNSNLFFELATGLSFAQKFISEDQRFNRFLML